MEFLFAAVLGAALGSFLGVVIDHSGCEVSQTSHSEKFAKLRGRSRCGSCRRQLAWWENIPILSFILLRGRCRTCRSPIPYWLPLIELAGALAGAVIAAQIDQISPIWLISQILIAAALIWIFFSDLVKGVVPDWAVAVGAFGAVLSQISQIGLISLIWTIAIAAAAASFFLFLVFITRGRGMGAGDITLAFFLGLWLGWPKIAIAVWLAFLLGAAVALGLIASGRKKFGQTVPFGPFFIIGSLLAQQWGQTIVDILF